MNPFAPFQFASLALEALAHALNPKLKTQGRRSSLGFALVYIVAILAGLGVVADVIKSLYFRN